MDIHIKDYSTGEMPEADEPQWTTLEVSEQFELLSFIAPLVVVRRRSDGVKGTLQFNHSPRIYFGFVEET
jgi:hypothetical protein